MPTKPSTITRLVKSHSGFSLSEVIIIIAIMAILTAVALPPYIQWRQNLMYRQAANDIATALKRAKSRAIATNLQHRVELNAANRSYQISRGNNAYRSSTWSNAGSSSDVAGGVLSSNVFLNLSGASTKYIQFSPNGTADVNVRLKIGDGVVDRYAVGVEISGRIRTDKVR